MQAIEPMTRPIPCSQAFKAVSTVMPQPKPTIDHDNIDLVIGPSLILVGTKPTAATIKPPKSAAHDGTNGHKHKINSITKIHRQALLSLKAIVGGLGVTVVILKPWLMKIFSPNSVKNQKLLQPKAMNF